MVTIRPEGPADIPAISAVHRSAFGGETEVRILETVRASPGFIPDLSLVAVEGRQVVGHILFSPLPIRGAGREWPALTLAPLGVLPGCQGTGIGSRLVEVGLRCCRELGHRIVIVVGEPSFYPRFGFSPAKRRGLEVPFPCPDEAFMVLGLAPGALDGVAGTVCYPSVFLEGLE